MFAKKWLFIAALVILAIFFLTMLIFYLNRPPGQRLRFTTIERDFTAGSLVHEVLGENYDPYIKIVVTKEEANQLQPLLKTDEAKKAWAAINFETHFVLLHSPGGGHVLVRYGITGIYHQDHQVAVYAQPGWLPDVDIPAIVRRPYHLVKVVKPSVWPQALTFQLYYEQGQAPITTTTYYLTPTLFNSPLPNP